MKRLLPFLVFALFSGASASLATSIIPLDAGAIFAKADVVVTGRVMKIETKENPDGMSTIVTDVTVNVETTIKGSVGLALVVRVPGGKFGELGLKVVGAPEFEEGDRVLLALENEGSGRFRVRGLHQGRFSLIETADRRDVFAVQDPFRKIQSGMDRCKADLAECIKDARIKLTIPEVKRLCGVAP